MKEGGRWSGKVGRKPTEEWIEVSRVIRSFRGERILIFGHVEEGLPELWDLYGGTVAIGADDVEASTFGERECEQLAKDATLRRGPLAAKRVYSLLSSPVGVHLMLIPC